MKPKLSYMIGEFKKKNKNIKVADHSDGYIIPILDDLVEKSSPKFSVLFL